MTPTGLISALLRDGAVLTLFRQGEAPRTLLLDAAHVLTAGTLICYALGGGVERLDFKEVRAEGQSVKFFDTSQMTARLDPITAEEDAARWQAWREHLASIRAAHAAAPAA